MKIFSFGICIILSSYLLAQEQTPQLFNECGGSLELNPEATYGILTNPNYPTAQNREGLYPNNADCVWSLDGDEQTYIQMKIWDLQVEPGEGNSNITCDYDYLNITITSAGSRKFCGAYAPEEIIRGMGKLTVHFVSDDSVNYRGFQITFQKVDKYDPCSTNNPCQGGSCEFDVKNLTTICVCPPGLQGKLCDEDVKECESQPCMNGGECRDDGEVNTYQCVCQPGWKGVNCETEQGSFCEPNPCKFGKCEEVNRTSITCSCDEGYAGDYCDNTTGCENPGIPGVPESRRFDFGTSLKYSCADTHQIEGKESSTCMEDGTWSNDMPECKVEGEEAGGSALSAWLLSMIALGGLLALNLVAFVSWMVYQKPWSLSRSHMDGNFTPSITTERRTYSGRKSSIYSISASQFSDSYMSDVA